MHPKRHKIPAEMNGSDPNAFFVVVIPENPQYGQVDIVGL